MVSGYLVPSLLLYTPVLSGDKSVIFAILHILMVYLAAMCSVVDKSVRAFRNRRMHRDQITKE